MSISSDLLALVRCMNVALRARGEEPLKRSEVARCPRCLEAHETSLRLRAQADRARDNLALAAYRSGSLSADQLPEAVRLGRSQEIAAIDRERRGGSTWNGKAPT